MGFFKEYPAFCSTLIVFLLLFVGGLVVDFQMASSASTAKRSFDKSTRVLKSLIADETALTDENVTAAKRNIADLEIQLEKRMVASRGKASEALSQATPQTGTDMLFQLQAFKDKFTNYAKSVTVDSYGNEFAEGHQVIPENFSFGFSRYIDSGVPPVDEHLSHVHEQKQILSYVLTKLFDSKIHSIVSIERESVIVAVEETSKKKRRKKKKKGDSQADEFVMSEALSSSVEGAVETHAFRLKFVGYTGALRSFLVELESFEMPLVIRSVEVQAMQKPEGAKASSSRQSNSDNLFDFGGDSAAEAPEPVISIEPVVDENESEFTVTLEYINVISADFNIANSDEEDGYEDDE